MNFSIKALLMSAFVLLCSINVGAQGNFFTYMGRSEVDGFPPIKTVTEMDVVKLDEHSIRSYLLKAPMEFRNNGKSIPLQIPLPNGTTETFNIVESPILSGKQAALHPEIKTYTGNGTVHSSAIIRLSITSSGFNAIIINIDNDAVYFESYPNASPGTYYSYFTRNTITPDYSNLRITNGGEDFISVHKDKWPHAGCSNTGTANKPTSTGSNLIKVRLAVAADGDFYHQHGNSAVSAFNAVVGYVNRANAVFRNELAVGFVLVSGQNLIYPDTATDPYTSSDEGTMLSENQVVMDDSIGTANYDIGHVLGMLINSSGGGLAYTPSLFNNAVKAGGVSQEADPGFFSQPNNDKLFFHEIGHQFGMSHSYNSTQGVCTSRNPPTSVEPGSGATCMSYAMICFNGFSGYDAFGDDYYDINPTPVDRGVLLQFHTASYQQATAYLTSSIPYPVGVVDSLSGNVAPTVTVPGNFTIPKSTPFALTGSATDTDPLDVLTYCWEGMNNGGLTDPDITTLLDPAKAPFSRTYAPETTGTRTFPILDSILNGSNTARADKLPSVSVVLRYNLTVRDNHPAAGGVNLDSVKITVDGNIGPFLETTNLSGSYPSLSNQTITWSVNGTNTATPNVKISLSTDGGYTFPIVLAASTPNDGSEVVTLPNTSTTTARIKVEALNNIFFDISNVNFTIISTPLPVTLLSFDARLQNDNSALLKWRTADEKNIESYDIEIAKESGVFTFKSNIKSKGASTASDYNFVTETLGQGMYYFRLKMKDLDGNASYSSTRTLSVRDVNIGNIKIYPSPTHGLLQVKLPVSLVGSKMNVVNNIGQVVMSFNATIENIRLVDISSLSSGIYILQVIPADNVIVRKKIIKE